MPGLVCHSRGGRSGVCAMGNEEEAVAEAVLPPVIDMGVPGDVAVMWTPPYGLPGVPIIWMGMGCGGDGLCEWCCAG